MTVTATPVHAARTTTRPAPVRPRVHGVVPPARGSLPAADAVPAVPLVRVDKPRTTPTLPRLEPEDAPVVRRADLDAPLPDPTGLCCAVARGAIEAVRGDRPLAQLARAVTPEILDALTTRARLVQAIPRPGSVPRPVRVRRARVELVGTDVAEATVVVDDVDRVRAAAIRAEVHRGRWRVVALEIG